jgi:hypothetical protein
MYPFDPASFASVAGELERLDLKAEAPLLWAVRLAGVPVEVWEYPPEPLWWRAEEYEAVVDAAYGVLLRLAAQGQGLRRPRG